jgi:hypothetical protein
VFHFFPSDGLRGTPAIVLDAGLTIDATFAAGGGRRLLGVLVDENGSYRPDPRSPGDVPIYTRVTHRRSPDGRRAGETVVRAGVCQHSPAMRGGRRPVRRNGRCGQRAAKGHIVYATGQSCVYSYMAR